MSSWRYRAGLFLIVGVVVIWVASAEVTQGIFIDYQQPFAITYLGASLMVVYLPVSFLRDWVYSLLRKHPSRSDKLSSGINSSPKHSQRLIEMEAQSLLVKKEIGIDLSARKEEQSLISQIKDDVDIEMLKERKAVTTKEMITYSIYLAPIWFVTEYLSNAALARTSVASTTVLSSTSCLFTLFIGVLLRQDSLNMSKVIAVFVCMAGVVMTTFGKTWATDESELSAASNGKRSLVGDIFGLLSAMTYGLFTVLLKKFAGEEGEGVDVQKLFGYVGLFTLVALWWLGKFPALF
ncbi:hypothetical protein ZIOFF_006869 [Zingiber officinale]|uniref:EamA domain-containing protein n=1 Tax=Zingiber officinale TaxID=94328 RepID=A0A8J5LSK8_ZINOF|nr:hypothetical protein ZIOFF_006869 [Zingiber officinale]